MPPRNHMPDHDLLIQIDTKLTILNETVNTYGGRFDRLEVNKVDLSDFKGLEAEVTVAAEKIALLQKFQWMLMGGLALAEIVAHAIFKL